MDLRQDLAQAIGDLGTYVTLDPDGEARTVYMVCRQNYGGVDSIRNKLLAWADSASIPPGADWGYGLMLAEDAPADMVRSSALRPAGRHGATLAHGGGTHGH